MVISHLIGGLGNQMFQYAAARALSIKLGVQLRLDISSFANYQLHQGFELQRIFNCSSEVASKENLDEILGWQSLPVVKRILLRPGMKVFRYKRLVVEPHFHYWSGINNLTKDCYLDGYWQSEKYFINIADQIRKDFTFKLPMQSANAELVRQIALVNSVSLHVRRGDYASNPKNIATHGLCSIEYYRAAIIHIVKHIKSPNFFVFSDDIEWVKDNLKLDFPHQYVDHNQGKESYNDMRLMSLCKHNIIANSSFSWWGAWLNSNEKKLVIAPKQWFAHKVNTSDLIPGGWLTL